MSKFTIVALHGWGGNAECWKTYVTLPAQWSTVVLNGPMKLDENSFAWFDLQPFFGQDYDLNIIGWNYELFPNTPSEYDEFSNGYRAKENLSKWQAGVEQAQDFLEKKFANSGPLVFIGFSQGAIVAAHMTLKSKLPIICGVAFCGGIVPYPDCKSRPLLMIQGADDAIVPMSWFDEAMRFAKHYQLPVEGVVIEQLQHDINKPALDLAINFIEKHTK